MIGCHFILEKMKYDYYDNRISISKPKSKISDINIEKMVPTARKMLEKIIEIQMSGDFKKGEGYVNEYFVWTPEMETMAQNIKKVLKTPLFWAYW